MMKLGSKADEKIGLILITLENEDEKEESVFGNLHALKGNNDYKGVICEDLTPNQRKFFEGLIDEAKEKNQVETDGVW